MHAHPHQTSGKSLRILPNLTKGIFRHVAEMTKSTSLLVTVDVTVISFRTIEVDSQDEKIFSWYRRDQDRGGGSQQIFDRCPYAFPILRRYFGSRHTYCMILYYYYYLLLLEYYMMYFFHH